MVVGELSNPFFTILLREIEQLARQAGFDVLVAQSGADQERELSVLNHLASLRVAGVLLFPHGSGSEYVNELKAIETPIVTVDHKIDNAEFDFVCSDNRLAASILTEHLLRLGHTRITQISGPPHLWSAVERIAGFKNTMASSGIEEVDIVNGGYVTDLAYDETMVLLTRENPPTAILSANNLMGLGCLSAMQDLGYKCPDDISLVAIDNLPWSEIFHPNLTVVAQNQQALAQKAINFLLDRIDAGNPFTGAGRESILVPKFIVGNSTKCL